MPAWSGICALGVLDDDAELSAMPAAAPPSAQIAPVAATTTILDLFIGIAPSFGDLGASSAVGEECGRKLNIRCETPEGGRRTRGHPVGALARTVRLADGRARPARGGLVAPAELGRVVQGRAGWGTAEAERLRGEGATVADLPTVREAVALPAAPKQPQPDDFDDAETLEREAAARLAARHERTGSPPPSEHLVAAQLAIEMARLCTERAGHAALSSRASTSPPGARSMRPQRRTRLAHGSPTRGTRTETEVAVGVVRAAGV